jgi:LacI family transcriptional regulator/LacI family asc operon transcriptional repressor
LKANGIVAREDDMQMCPKGIYETKAIVARLYQEKKVRFDGVVTSDDFLAVGALKYASGAGIRVPEELSIVGYNNSILASCTEPELTSIDTKVELLCVNTVNTLMRVLEGGKAPAKTMVAADIVYRRTTRLQAF